MAEGRLTVLFFASLRDQVACERLELPLPDPPTVDALLALLRERLGRPAEALRDESVRLAVNQELVDGSGVLRAGDEVAFLPPVTGG